jgi:hypothetical protein
MIKHINVSNFYQLQLRIENRCQQGWSEVKKFIPTEVLNLKT